MKRKSQIGYNCPCCGKNKILSEISITYKRVQKQQPNYQITDYQKMLRRFQYWACDNCITSGKALKPKREFNFPHVLSPLNYIDKELICKECQSPFVFSKEEQYHYMEELKFERFLPPHKCLKCRKTVRDKKYYNNRLMILLEKENWNEEELHELYDIYTEIGSREKANKFKNLLMKQNKKV